MVDTTVACYDISYADEFSLAIQARYRCVSRRVRLTPVVPSSADFFQLGQPSQPALTMITLRYEIMLDNHSHSCLSHPFPQACPDSRPAALSCHLAFFNLAQVDDADHCGWVIGGAIAAVLSLRVRFALVW
jgi:hypothetical protein